MIYALQISGKAHDGISKIRPLQFRNSSKFERYKSHNERMKEEDVYYQQVVQLDLETNYEFTQDDKGRDIIDLHLPLVRGTQEMFFSPRQATLFTILRKNSYEATGTIQVHPRPFWNGHYAGSSSPPFGKL